MKHLTHDYYDLFSKSWERPCPFGPVHFWMLNYGHHLIFACFAVAALAGLIAAILGAMQ